MNLQCQNNNFTFGKTLYTEPAQKFIETQLKNHSKNYQRKCETYYSCSKGFDDVLIIVDKKKNKNKLFATMNNKKITEMNLFQGLKTFLKKVALKNLDNTKQI